MGEHFFHNKYISLLENFLNKFFSNEQISLVYEQGWELRVCSYRDQNKVKRTE